MRIICNLDSPVFKRLEVLAKMRGKEPAHLAEELLTQLLTKGTGGGSGSRAAMPSQATPPPPLPTAADESLTDLTDVIAARLIALDKSGNAIKAVLAELSMLDETPHSQAVAAQLKKSLPQGK
jgi:hypothetical protein